MDIEQVKSERVKLAADISELVNSFQRRTGATVRSVDLQQFISDASETPLKTHVEVRLELR